MQVLSRQAAKEQGLLRHFTGKPCCRGHLSERYTSNGMCVQCLELRNQNKELKKKYRDAGREHNNARHRQWLQENKERVKEVGKAWRQNNLDKLAFNAKMQKLLRKRVRCAQAISKLFSDEIRSIYKNCPEGHHVDHIVPLRGKTVSGLHVPWNMQYLPAAENVKKGNKLLINLS